MSLFGIHLDLNPTSGVYLIGTFVSNILLGATIVQTYIYFRSFQDTYLIKATVLVLVVLELLHGILSMHALYHYLIINFLNPLALVHSIWSVTVLFGIAAAIVLVVHVSYAIRIYYVSGRKLPIPIFITFLSLALFGETIWLMAEIFKNPSLLSLTGIRDNLAKAILIFAAIIDFLIAGTLTFYLNKARTGIKQTDKLIDRLMIYTINNGILTSVVDIVALAFIFAFPNDLYSVAVSQIIGNLYSNSLMAMLNSRNRPNKVSRAYTLEISSHELSTFGAATNPEVRNGLTKDNNLLP